MEIFAKTVNDFCEKRQLRYIKMPWVPLSHFNFLISTFYVYWLKVFQVFICSHESFFKEHHKNFFKKCSRCNIRSEIIYFTLKAFFVLKIFKFLSWLFGRVTSPGRETSPRPFPEKLKLSISLDRYSKVLYSLFLLYAKLKVKTICLYLKLRFFKKQKKFWSKSPILFSAWFFKKNVFLDIFY